MPFGLRGELFMKLLGDLQMRLPGWIETPPLQTPPSVTPLQTPPSTIAPSTTHLD